MLDKAFDNVQEIGKQCAAFGRRMTREALAATSSSLENAARYLKDLRSRVPADAPVERDPEPTSNGNGSQG